MKSKYKKTRIACYHGFITRAIAANFAPLLFLTFHRTCQISSGKIAFRLLLGIGRCHFAFHHLFCRFQDRKLAYSGVYLGLDPAV